MDPLPFLFRFISSGKVDEIIFNDSIFSSNFHRDKVTFLDQRSDRSLIHCPESAQNQPSNGAGCDPTRRGGECSASGKPGQPTKSATRNDRLAEGAAALPWHPRIAGSDPTRRPAGEVGGPEVPRRKTLAEEPKAPGCERRTAKR